MAGSALLAARNRSDKLEIVTLTINNACNLRCPHCYLQYESDMHGCMKWSDVEHVLDSDFRHLAIVGKEPLANREAAHLTARLVEAASLSGRTCSLITNGLNLPLLGQRTLEQLTWLDVSIDSGPADYGGYRGGSYAKLARGIAYAKAAGLRDLRILHTVSSGNLAGTTAALQAALDFAPEHVVISPFQETRPDGRQSVAMVCGSSLLSALERAGAHDDSRMWLTFDSGYASQFGTSVKRASAMFADRFIYVDSDPIERGLIRVTYDGLVLSPLESIHTSDYRSIGRPLRERALGDWYRHIAEAALMGGTSVEARPH